MRKCINDAQGNCLDKSIIVWQLNGSTYPMCQKHYEESSL